MRGKTQRRLRHKIERETEEMALERVPDTPKLDGRPHANIQADDDTR